VDSILGLPVNWEDANGNEIHPLHILVVAKGIDQEGEEVDGVFHTDGLSLANSLGLARFAVLFIEHEVKKQLGLQE
jgi:hypothetical protein